MTTALTFVRRTLATACGLLLLAMVTPMLAMLAMSFLLLAPAAGHLAARYHRRQAALSRARWERIRTGLAADPALAALAEQERLAWEQQMLILNVRLHALRERERSQGPSRPADDSP